MYFIGQAANLRGKILRHTFAIGTKKDSAKLREHLAKRYNTSTEDIFFYHNGRSAITAGLKAFLPEDKDTEILITALTCYAVFEAVKSAGFKPVFADIDDKTLHYNAKTLENALAKHPKVKAIIVQNNLGIPVNMKEIEKVARAHDLLIIEDLAHCAGISYADGREAGCVGDFAALSFGKGKSIDTISGGALVIRSHDKVLNGPVTPSKLPKFGDRFRDRFYPVFGTIIRGLYHVRLGRIFTSFLLKTHQIQRSADARLNLNVRLTHWQAKLALKQLESLPKNRPPIREFFLVDDRDQTLNELERNGFIVNEVWYDVPVSPERYYEKVNFPEDECKNATRIAKRIVNLPTHYRRTALKTAREIIEKHKPGEK